ncbi:MAG: hypothetical protein RL260_921, partial [Pseudomonadota bacterium]
QLQAHFGDKVFQTIIPRNVRLAEAPSYGLPGVVFDPGAKGSLAFIAFAREMVERVGVVLPKAKVARKKPAKKTQTAAKRQTPSA